MSRIFEAMGEPLGGVLVIHSWWGLTSSFVEFGKALRGEGFTVAVADLFDGKTAKTEAQARELRSARRREPMYKTLQNGLETVRERLTEQGRLGVVGFSMGGHWAVWLAQHSRPPIDAVVIYYAARAGDFSHCRAPMLCHFAEHDPFVRPAARRKMEKAASVAGCRVTSFDYSGTAHWFAESAQRDVFDHAAAEQARMRTVAFLKREFAR